MSGKLDRALPNAWLIEGELDYGPNKVCYLLRNNFCFGPGARI